MPHHSSFMLPKSTLCSVPLGMISLASLLRRNKRLNTLLICLLLYGGIRTFIPVDLRSFQKLSILNKYPTYKSIFRIIRQALLAAPSCPSSFRPTPGVKPHIPTCSSLPQATSPSNSPQRTSVQQPQGYPTKASLDDPAGVPQDSFTNGGITQAKLSNESNTASSSSSADLFEWDPPEPFESIHPISAAQLVPRRWPISRTEPPDVSNPYTHPEMIPQNASIGYIPPYIVNFTPDKNPPGWITYTHPQGSLYYYHQEKNAMTSANILDAENYRIITETMNQLFQKLKHDGIETPPDTQLVLDMRWDKHVIGYYFATLQGRCLFWAEGKRVMPLFKRVAHVWSHSHIRHLMEAEFWYVPGVLVHFQYFPHVQILPQHIVREIKGFLLFTCNDQLFNANTTSEYSTDEVDKALSIVNSIPQEFIGTRRSSDNEVGFFMYIAALHRFDNHHGQPNARWHRDDFLYDDSEDLPRTRFIQLVSPLLFYTPETYYQSLCNIMNDGNVFFEAWRTFVVELHQEWNQLTVIATVILATNVAFLAIPSIDNGDHPDLRSAAQICSYLSIVFSVCSILLGQLFSRYHRIKGWERFDERITDNYDMLMDIGCSKLAVMYSLPYALLSWSLIAFLVAFLVMCFNGTREVVRLFVGIPSAVFLFVMVYCVYKMRANDEERSESPLVRSYEKLRQVYWLYTRRRSWRRESTEFDEMPNPQTPSIPQTPNV
ncbi:hypothetical protein D9756_003357 [Leucocoprinus leucothites]|uniref:Transmembrane protein n=1 Tax=Leucocoprinus leucothites TaxID=201217 RepID=A0A8H5G6Y4_9AGAR|nr:hypothetical protein D9756_003357 [Leucoagaricus leucothites]